VAPEALSAHLTRQAFGCATQRERFYSSPINCDDYHIYSGSTLDYIADP
jgi:hypothetical protein